MSVHYLLQVETLATDNLPQGISLIAWMQQVCNRVSEIQILKLI